MPLSNDLDNIYKNEDIQNILLRNKKLSKQYLQEEWIKIYSVSERKLYKIINSN